MFTKMIYLVGGLVALIWFAGDRLTAAKDEALGTVDNEARYSTSGYDGW